jgi:tRNA(Ile)-lysidine synthase
MGIDLLPALQVCCSLQSGCSFLLAVSGGPDSMAMLHLFVEFSEKIPLRLEVAHVHHGLRGTEADADAVFVENACARLGLPFHLFCFDVKRWALEKKVSLETAGRMARRLFFTRCANERKLDYVALAHTQEDQAETVLMNFLRGAGAAGLRGILPRNGIFIHPLLSFSKRELLDYLKSRNIYFRQDTTNVDTHFLRNRIRHIILPYLEKEFGGFIKEHLLQMADIFREEEAWIEDFLTPIFEKRFFHLGYGVFELRLSSQEFPVALERRLLRKAVLAILGSLEGIDFSSLENMRDLLKKNTGKRFVLARLVVEKTEKGLALSPPFPMCKEEVPLPIPGEVYLKGLGVWVKATLAEKFLEAQENLDGHWLDLDKTGNPLILRTRRPGDFFSPEGMLGKKKLQDFFVDRKVPRLLRDRIPVLASPRGVVWIAGYGVDRRMKACCKTSHPFTIEVKYEKGDRNAPG